MSTGIGHSRLWWKATVSVFVALSLVTAACGDNGDRSYAPGEISKFKLASWRSEQVLAGDD